MKVLVMTAVAENLRDLQIVIVARNDGALLSIVSSVITLEEAAAHRNGNPYCIYGDAVAEFIGCNKFDTCISVFACTGGNLRGWL